MLAEETSVLSPVTSKAAPHRINWTGEMERAFTRICESVSDICVLTMPLSDDVFSVVTGASSRGIGGVLQM